MEGLGPSRGVNASYQEGLLQRKEKRHGYWSRTPHSAVTAVYRRTRDLFLAQRFARHASPITTVVYTHPSDEELYAGIRDLPC